MAGTRDPAHDQPNRGQRARGTRQLWRSVRHFTSARPKKARLSRGRSASGSRCSRGHKTPVARNVDVFGALREREDFASIDVMESDAVGASRYPPVAQSLPSLLP